MKDKLISILTIGNIRENLINSYHNGTLIEISPFLSRMWGYDQNTRYHHLNLFEHTLLVLDNVISQDPGATLELRLAALFHDIAKPDTQSINKLSEWCFYGHEKESAKLTREVLIGLGFEDEVIESVCLMIETHMLLKGFSDNGYGYNGARRITRRRMKSFGKHIQECLILIEADNMAHSEKYCIRGQKEEFIKAMKELG